MEITHKVNHLQLDVKKLLFENNLKLSRFIYSTLYNWSDVNQELLDKTTEEFKKRIFDYEKLTLSFWVNKIKNTIDE